MASLLGEVEGGYYGVGYSKTPPCGWWVIEFLETGELDLLPALSPIPDGAVVVGTAEKRCGTVDLNGHPHAIWERGRLIAERYSEGAWLSLGTQEAVQAIVKLGGVPLSGKWLKEAN